MSGANSSGVPLVPPTCFPVGGIGRAGQDGRREVCAQKQKPARRVSVDGREACAPCEQGDVRSGCRESTGGKPWQVTAL